MNDEILRELRSVAEDAARLAGAYIKSEASAEREVSRKIGGHSLASQVVTAVDLESDRILSEALAPSIAKYDLGLLTEESEDDSSRFEKDYFWCVDPLDGTLSFVRDQPGYSVIISLISKAGLPQLGVIWDVAAEEMHSVVRGEMKKRVISLSNRVSWFMDHSMTQMSNFAQWQDAVATMAGELGYDGVDEISHAGAGLNACWAARSAPAIYFKCPKPEEGGGSIWDFAATSCLFSELRFPVTNIFGEPLQLNREGKPFMNREGVLFATSEELAMAVEELYREIG